MASKSKGHDSQRGKHGNVHNENRRELTGDDDASSDEGLTSDQSGELDQAASENAGVAEVLRELNDGELDTDQLRELARDAEQLRELAGNSDAEQLRELAGNSDAEQLRELADAERRELAGNRDAEQPRELTSPERRAHKSTDEDASEHGLRVRLRIARWRWPHLFPNSPN